MTIYADINDRLIGVLRAVAGVPGLEYERPPEPLHGGFWAELLSFSLSRPPDGWPAELVARLMPDPAPGRKETIVQHAVAAAGYPTPRVRASGGPDAGLGRAFMVMDRAPGRPVLPGLEAGLTLATVLRVLKVPGLLAAAMVRLHALDPGLVRGELEQISEVPVTVPGLLSGLERLAGESGRPDLAGTASWLDGHPPRPAADVIWHVPGWQRPLVRRRGRALARRFGRGYQRRTATAVDSRELRWYQAVACLRALVEVAGWAHEGTAGAHAGHPWLASGPAFARRRTALTGIPVQPR